MAARWLSSKLRAGLPGGRDAGLLLAARVLMSGQRALVGVVVPIYLARRGFSATELGAMFSLVALVSALISALIGFAADRVGRKPFVMCVPGLSAAAALVFSFTDVTVVLFAAAALGSFGRGSGAGGGQIGPYQPAEQALLAGMAGDGRRRNALFGLVASASAAGGLLGSVLAAAALAVLASLCAAPVREARPSVEGEARDARRSPRRRWGRRGGSLPAGAGASAQAETAGARAASRRLSSPARLSPSARRLVYRLWATNSFNGAAVGLFGPFITYWLYRRYGAGPAEVGTLYTVGNVLTIATNQLAAPIAARHGTVRTVVVVRTAQALLLPVLAVMPAFAAAGAVYTGRLIVQRIGMSLRQSFVMGAAPASERARVAALSQLPTQGLSALSPTLSGYLLSEVSLAAPFVLAGALQLINALLFHRFFIGMDGEEAAAADGWKPATVPVPRPPRAARAHQASPDASSRGASCPGRTKSVGSQGDGPAGRPGPERRVR